MVSDNGLVENRVIDVPLGMSVSTLVEAGNYLTARLAGRSFAEARASILSEIEQHRSQLDELTEKVVSAGLATWGGDARPSATSGFLIVRGHAKLLEDVTSLGDLERIRGLFEMLEARQSMLRLVELTQAAKGMQIFIGSENELFGLSGCSMIVAPYTAGAEGGARRHRGGCDRRDRPDPHELRPHHSAGRLHRAGGQPAPGHTRHRDETMNDNEHDKTARRRSEASRRGDGAAQPRRQPAPAPTRRGAPELKDRLLRTLAEMENLRRRTQREVEEARKFAVTGFARDLLDVGDNLGRALASVPPEAREQSEFMKNLVLGRRDDRALAAGRVREAPGAPGRAAARATGSTTSCTRRCSRCRPPSCRRAPLPR